MKKEKAMAITMAAINGTQMMPGLAMPLAQMAADGMEYATKLDIVDGGTLFDQLFFKTAHAFTTPVTGSVSGETVDGVQDINDGGSATDTTINWGGDQNVNSGGSATDTTINIDGTQNVNSGGSATSTTINTGGRQDVNSGGSATSTTINTGGQQNVFSGGSATSTTVSSGGILVLEGNAAATSATLNEGYVLSATTEATLDANSGAVTISGGHANNITLNSGATLDILAGHDATSTTISGGTQNVYGSATGTTISGGGEQNVSGSATDTTINWGGKQYVSGSATNTTINGGFQFVQPGGSATSTTINTGGVQIVQSGGSATNTTINTGGAQNVYGSATSTTINTDGTQYVYSGGSATSTAINQGGKQDVASGCSALSTTVSSGGILVLEGNAAATSATLNEGYVLSATTEATLNANSGAVTIRGGRANNITLNSGATLDILAGDDATSTTISGGTQNVYDGGSATNTTISGGTQKIYSGATISGTTFSGGGTQSIQSNAAMSGQVVNNGGTQEVLLGGTATNTTISGGTQRVYGIASDTKLQSGGTQKIYSGATISGTTFDGGGTQSIQSGAAMSGQVVNSGGTQEILLGGTANNTKLESSGTQNVSSGGTATSTTISGGIQNVLNGGKVISTTISGGTQHISSGGKAESTTIAGGTQYVSTGGTATSTTIAGGTQYVASGGITSGTTINSGKQQVESGGIIIDTVLSSGGSIDLKSNGEIQYTADRNFAGTISASSGSFIRRAKTDKAIGAQVTIANLQGSTNFYINTDIAKGQADKITITSGSNGAKHGVGVNYDPCYDNGAGIKAAAGGVLFADVPKGTTFTPLETEYSAYTFKPVITSNTSDTTDKYSITEITGGKPTPPTPEPPTPQPPTPPVLKPSEAAKASADMVVGTTAAMRIETNNVMKRMGELRHNEAGIGTWVRVYSGKLDSELGGRSADQKYNAIQVGYDRRIKQDSGVWYVGGAIGHLKSDANMERSEGKTRSTSLALYGTWLHDKGHYVDIIAKQSRIGSEYTSYLNNPQLDNRLKGDYSNWGTTLSVEYGCRKQLGGGVYIEPQIELGIGRINSASYKMSDGTNVHNGAAKSFLGRIGVAYGKDDGKNNYYAKVSAVREFSAEARTTLQKGMMGNVSVNHDLKETWLEFALGLTSKMSERSNGYMELTTTTGTKTKTPWQVNMGMRWSF